MTGVPLLLVDGHNLLFRACFGTPAQIWSRDEHDKRDLTTQFMFFALLRKGINDELPDWPEVVVVFDGQDGSAQRKDTDPGYKANRPEDAEALKPILALPDVKAGLDTVRHHLDRDRRRRGRRRDRHPGQRAIPGATC